MLILYVVFQLIFLALIVIGETSFIDILFLNILMIVPILLNLVFCFRKKTSLKLKLALFFTIIAEFCFLFIHNTIFGFMALLFVQSFYYMYINKNKDSKILLAFILIINMLFILFFAERAFVLEFRIYFTMFIFNIMVVYKLSLNDRKYKVLSKSLYLLLLSNICAGLKFVFLTNGTIDTVYEDIHMYDDIFMYFDILMYIDIIEWLFYIPSQVLLVLCALELDDAFLYRLLQPIYRWFF